MNTLNKYRVLNRYRILIFCIFFSGLFISFFFSSGFFDATLVFDKNAPDIIGRGEQVQQSLIHQLLNLYNYTTSVGNYISFILPVLSCAFVILFVKEKKGLFFFKYIRNIKFKSHILRTIFIHSFISGCTFFISYTIFLFIGIFLSQSKPEAPVQAFDLMFSNGFSIHSFAWIGYLIEGFIKCFLFPFVYTFFSCSISLHNEKTYECIFIPVIYYFIGTIVIGVNLGFIPLSPAYPIVSLTYSLTILKSIFPLSIPLLISIFLIILYFFKGERIS